MIRFTFCCIVHTFIFDLFSQSVFINSTANMCLCGVGWHALGFFLKDAELNLVLALGGSFHKFALCVISHCQLRCLN